MTIWMILVHLATLYSPADNSNALIVLTFQAHHTAPRVSLHQQIMLNKNFKVHCVPITKEPLLALELFCAFGTHMALTLHMALIRELSLVSQFGYLR